MSLTLFFVSHVSMKFECSLVKSFFRQFSVGFTYFRSVSCFVKIRSKLLDLYYSIADHNKRILCTSLRQSKVSLKLIYYVLLLNTMYSRKNMQTCFKLDENGTKQNKKCTTYLAFTALENGC